MDSRSAVVLAAPLALAAWAGFAGASEPDAPAGDGAFPTVVITREQLLSSGKASIGEYLQWLPQQGNALNAQTTGEGDGAVTVNLRSLGPGRTLVLVDGRRVVPGGGRLSLGTDVDLHAIPLYAVERIELLDGVGSAVHGSEALAGVVNVVTRRGLEGTEATASFGATSRGDGTVGDVSVVSGLRGDRGSFVLGAGYATAGSVLAGARAWSSTRHGYDYATGTVGPPVVSTATPAGRFQLDPATCTTPACAALLAAYGPGSRAWTVDPALPGGARPYVEADGYDLVPGSQLSAPSQRVTAHAAGELALGSAARVYLEASFANRRSSEQSAPTALLTGAYDRLQVSAQSAYNPYGVDLADVRRRLVELGPRVQAHDFDTFRAVAGARGTLQDAFGPLQGWSWDAAFEYGRTSGTRTSTGDLRVPELEASLGPSYLLDPSSGEVWCGTPGNGVSGCVPLDLLHGPGSITPDQLAGVAFGGVDASAAQLRALRGSVRGELLALQPGRAATLALGVEVRDQSGSFTPNPVAAAGESSGNNSLAVSGRYDAQEAFAELLLPIWSGAPGLERLDVSLAGRVFHYATFGTDAVYQLGIRYAPLTWLTIRAGASTAYRAPDIEELYRPVEEYYPIVADPCSGVTSGGFNQLDPTSGLYAQCNATGVSQGAPPGGTANNGDDRSMKRGHVGGNPHLGPEAARRLGLGLVVEPLPRLSLALDYSRIHLERAVNELGAGVIVRSCYTASPDPGTAATASSRQQHCGLIHRDPAFGRIELIDDRLQNAGGTLVSVLDLAAAYAIPTGAGRFDLALAGTWLLGHDTTQPDGSVVHQAGYGDYLLVDPRLKVNARATWTLGRLSAGLALRYVGRYRECDASPCSVEPPRPYVPAPRLRTVEAWSPLDLFVGWTAATAYGTTTLRLGVTNALDQDPPASYAAYAASASDPSTYDFLGRQWLLRLAQAF